MTDLQIKLFLTLTAPRPRDERGDVPGWVLITVMTAGLVSILYTLARDQLAEIFTTAIHSVKD